MAKATGRKALETTKVVGKFVLGAALLAIMLSGCVWLAVAFGLTPLAGYVLFTFVLWASYANMDKAVAL